MYLFAGLTHLFRKTLTKCVDIVFSCAGVKKEFDFEAAINEEELPVQILRQVIPELFKRCYYGMPEQGKENEKTKRGT